MKSSFFLSVEYELYCCYYYYLYLSFIILLPFFSVIAFIGVAFFSVAYHVAFILVALMAWKRQNICTYLFCMHFNLFMTPLYIFSNTRYTSRHTRQCLSYCLTRTPYIVHTRAVPFVLACGEDYNQGPFSGEVPTPVKMSSDAGISQ
jgi:hypothetical protein